MTIDLLNDFSFVRSPKRRRSTYDNVPQLNDLTSQYPVLLSIAENLSTLDLLNLGLASRTTWTHLSAAKSPLRLRKGVIKSAIRCEGLHIQPRPQSPHQGTPYILACPSSQMEKVRPCEGCGVGVCEVSRLSSGISFHRLPLTDERRPAASTQPKEPCSPTRTSAAGSFLRARHHALIPSRPISRRCSTAWCAAAASLAEAATLPSSPPSNCSPTSTNSPTTPAPAQWSPDGSIPGCASHVSTTTSSAPRPTKRTTPSVAGPPSSWLVNKAMTLALCLAS